MASKSTTQIGVRLAANWLDDIGHYATNYSQSKAAWCRAVLIEAAEEQSQEPVEDTDGLFGRFGKSKKVKAPGWEGGRSGVIAIRLANDAVASIKRLASQQGLSTSEWCQIALVDHIIRFNTYYQRSRW